MNMSKHHKSQNRMSNSQTQKREQPKNSKHSTTSKCYKYDETPNVSQFLQRQNIRVTKTSLNIKSRTFSNMLTFFESQQCENHTTRKQL